MGRPRGSKNRVQKIIYKNKISISVKTKELRKEIFSRIGLSAPWIFSPLQHKTIKDLHDAVDGLIENYLK